jgi:hypothetical protein
MVKARVLFVLFTLVLCLAPLQAATFVVPPDEWLIDDSPVIVSGTVMEAHARYTDKQEIETVFRFAVDDVLKGTLAGTDLELIEWGGMIGDRWMLQSGSPRYEIGKRYLVFLYPNRNGEWTTQNLALGRFAFVHSGRGDVLVRDVDEIRGWDIYGKAAQEVERNAADFLTFIRNRANGQSETPDYAINGKLTPAPQSRQVTPNFVGYDFDDAASVAVGAWKDDPDSTVNYSISGTPATGDTKNVGDGEERFIEEDPHGDIAGAFTGSGVVATAFMSGGADHTYEGKTYISINGSDVVTQNGIKASNLGQSAFRTAMAHEVGHTLGFRHSNQSADGQSSCSAPLPCVSGSSNAVMNSSVGSLNGVLQAWDRDAVAAAYGSGGDASDYTLKFCANGSCTSFTPETGRRTSTSVSFRLAEQALTCTPPSITTHPASKSIAAGATTSLSVVAAGTGPFTYQWYIGASGDTSTRIGGATSATLSNLSPASTTQYWVEVTGQCAPVANSNTATITVQTCTSPSITVQPQPKSVSLGSSAKMSVTATGTSPFTYQWYVGNSGDTSNPIAGATSASPNITLNATANVWVRVTGQCAPAVDSSSVTITVNPCPTVVVGIPTATGAATSWTLSVNATSLATGTLTYEWYRGSNPGSPNAPKIGEGQTLPVTVTTLTQFWVRVTNSCGSSKESELVVVAPCQLPVISAQPADRTIFKGASTQLTVGVTGDAIAVQWYQGVAPDKSIPVAGGTSINVGPLQTTTSYWAGLTNTCGEISTRTVIVTVDESCSVASITAQPADRTVSAGASTDLTVGFTGDNVTVQWYRGTAPDKSNPLQTGATITVGPILTTTTFWAALTNTCGEVATRTVTATVEGSCVAPAITTQPLAKQEVSGGASATLHVVANGTPELHYQWYEAAVVGDISKPVGTDSSTFITPPLFAGKKYWVKITNACGFAVSNGAEVTVPKGRRHAVRS